MSRRKHKIVSYTDTLREILECGNVLEDLHGQMEEWQSNLEGNNMEHLPKYEEVQTAVETLDSAGSEIESNASDLVQALEKCGEAAMSASGHIGSILDQTVTYTLMVPYKGRGEPRWMQRDNAIAALQAVVEHLEDEDNLVKVDDEGEPITRTEDGEKVNVLWTDENEDIETYRQGLADALEEAAEIEFPGMFG